MKPDQRVNWIALQQHICFPRQPARTVSLRTIKILIRCFASNETKSLQIGEITLKNVYFSTID